MFSSRQCKPRMEDVGRSLEHLVQVLQTDNSMVEHLKDKYHRSEREKQSLLATMEMMKMRLVEMKTRFKDQEKIMSHLQVQLKLKDEIIDDLTSKCRGAVEEVEVLRGRLSSCEKEKYDVMLHIERFIMEIETKDDEMKSKKHDLLSSRNSSDSGISFGRSSNNNTTNSVINNKNGISGKNSNSNCTSTSNNKIARINEDIHTTISHRHEKTEDDEDPFNRLTMQDRELIGCGKLINYAKTMMSMKNKVDTYSQQIQHQQTELRKSNEELRKYRQNYWDRSMFHNLVLQELLKMENISSFSLVCCGRSRIKRDSLCRIRELLAESMTSYV